MGSSKESQSWTIIELSWEHMELSLGGNPFWLLYRPPKHSVTRFTRKSSKSAGGDFLSNVSKGNHLVTRSKIGLWTGFRLSRFPFLAKRPRGWERYIFPSEPTEVPIRRSTRAPDAVLPPRAAPPAAPAGPRSGPATCFVPMCF